MKHFFSVDVEEHFHAHVFERAPQLLEAFLAALRALGEDGFDLAAALERGGQRVEHREIVTAKERQDQPALRGADDAKQRRLPFSRIEDQPFLRLRNVWAATRRHS